MALILEHYVEDWRTAYNPIEYVLKETNILITNQPRFKYLFKIEVASTVLATLKVPKRSVTRLGRCDVQRIIETHLSKNLGTINTTTTADSFTSCPESIEEFEIYFGYEYETAGVLNQYFVNYERWDDLGVSRTNESILVYNGCLPNERGSYLNFVDYQATNYAYTNFVQNGLNRRFLTNTPSVTSTTKNKENQDFQLTDNGFMYFLYKNSTDPITSMKIDTYDSGGTFLASYEFGIGTPAVDGIEMQNIPIAPNSINNIDASFLTSGTQPVLTSSVSSYRVFLFNSTVRVSESRFINIVDSDCKFDKVRLEFMNSFGGFDSFNFTKVNRRMESIERKNYKMNPKNMSATGRITYSKQDSEKIQYHTKSKPSMKLTSDWITESKFDWLLELMESPEIYLHRGNERVSVLGVKGDWEQKLTNSDKLFNLEIEIEFSVDNYRQRF